MKKIINWHSKDDPYTKEGEILLHEKIHQQKTKNGLFTNNKNRLELDYPQLYEPNKLVPVEGKAGTLIVFDSDIFHQGGKINIKDKERIVLRSHNYLSV